MDGDDELVDRNRFLEDIIQSLPGGVFQFYAGDDGSMYFRYRSCRAHELAYLPPDWQLGINAHPEDRDRLIESVHEAVRSVSTWSFEGRCVTASGDVRWIEGSALPTRTTEGIIFNGLLLDITAKKLTEEWLRESEERFRNAFEYAAIGMTLTSLDGRYLKVNQSMCDLLGYSERELLEKTFQDITHPDDLVADLDYVRQMLARETFSYQMEKRYFHKLGNVIWVLLSVSMVCDDLGAPLYFISQVQDITERKRVEEEKQRFYRDTIMSVTQGKLDLVSLDEVKEYLDSAELAMTVVSPADTVVARDAIREFCELKAAGNGRWDLFEMAAGEAMTNAIKHADEGRVYAGVDSEVIWIAVSDEGLGIPALTLPGATLRAGFSTKISMGMGYSIMLEASDCILLSTGPQGTTVVLLKDIAASEQALSLDDLPDTWDQY